MRYGQATCTCVLRCGKLTNPLTHTHTQSKPVETVDVDEVDGKPFDWQERTDKKSGKV